MQNHNIYMSNFVDTYNELMAEKDLNSNSLELACGLSKNITGRWQKGTAIPGLKNLIIFADFFKCSLDYLFCLSNQRAFKKAAIPSDFTTRYVKLLEKTKMKAADFAKANDFKDANVSKWKRGTMPNILFIIDLAKSFNVSIEYLIGRADNT